ncbi:response regulator [Rhodohalobacter sp. SW132]|uniref:response regulator n=1 Tax=Rhodohalobacter sp. SW132 TaxID=2293433 RepID=UPI000E22951A|nr:response regulator [Rhodohalobacter sp. SW132]REL38715.1 response regulator [Rhodohalobacter sp. SW132]
MLSGKERTIKKIGHPIRVLIVEDSEDDTELMIRSLRKGGFYPRFKRVQTASGLRSMLDQEMWDIVLCDHNMPGFDSISALKIINEKRSDIPFMIISDSITNGIAEELLSNGASATLSKSNLNALVPAVVRELKKSRAKKDNSTHQREKKQKTGKNGLIENGKISLFAAKSVSDDMDKQSKSLVNGETGSHSGNGKEKSESVKNILIVEDELIQSILLEKLIKSMGYTVIGKATTGADAIEKAMQLKPDLITMDISLQDDIDGIMATKTIQDKSMIPVIYISGNSDKYNFERAEKTNFIDFIPKPVSKESLQKSFIKAENICQKKN